MPDSKRPRDKKKPVEPTRGGILVARSMGGLPFHYQVAQILRDEITRREIKTGKLLPTETQLCERFGVSRAVVRQALQTLTNEGYISRYPGKGTFVRNRAQYTSFELRGSMRDIVALSFKARRFQRVDFSIEPAEGKVATTLKVKEGEDIVRVKGVRFLKDVPLIYSVIYLPYHIGIVLRKKVRLTGPTMVFLEKQLGIRFQSSRQEIRAGQASEEIAKHLNISPGDPILLIDRVYYDLEGNPIFTALSHFPGERYGYVVHFARNDAHPG
jgi:GntR family transcriptional regulator